MFERATPKTQQKKKEKKKEKGGEGGASNIWDGIRGSEGGGGWRRVEEADKNKSNSKN